MEEQLTIDKISAMFTLAEIKVKAIYEIINQYHGKRGMDPRFLIDNPWFLVSTEYGNIVLGPRKRVYQLQWDETNLREYLPVIWGQDNTTSTETYIHAYTEEHLLTNIKNLGKALHSLAFDFVQKD